MQKAILITQDKDFGELVYRLKQVHHGIILIRLHGKKPKVKAQIVLDALKKYANDLKLAFTVIHEDFIKIRK